MTPSSMKTRRNEGKTLIALVALLLLLCTTGGVNYHRNFTAERDSEATRPFHGYQLEDLESLRGAYADELESLTARYAQQNSNRRRSRGEGLMDERVADFERMQTQSNGLRELNTRVAEREARVREIDSEISFRHDLGEGWDVHVRRLTKI